MKTTNLTVRLEEEDKERLKEMCRKTVRSMTDMVTLFIRREYERMAVAEDAEEKEVVS